MDLWIILFGTMFITFGIGLIIASTKLLIDEWKQGSRKSLFLLILTVFVLVMYAFFILINQ